MQCEKCGCEDLHPLEYGEKYTIYECLACGHVVEEEHLSGDVVFDAIDEDHFG